MSWYQQTSDGWIVSLHIQPGAKKTEVVGLHGEALKIRLAAPPVDGKANAALCAFVAECLDVPKRQVQVVAGLTSRQKRVAVHHVDSTLEKKLLGLVTGPMVNF